MEENEIWVGFSKNNPETGDPTNLESWNNIITHKEGYLCSENSYYCKFALASQYFGSDSHLYLKFGPVDPSYINFIIDYQAAWTGNVPHLHDRNNYAVTFRIEEKDRM